VIQPFAELPRGPGKVLPLDDAVRRAVRPGMSLHLAFTHNRPAAAIAALVRAFRGERPGFTLVHLFTCGPALALLSEGLVDRLITALVCEPYPAPAPSRVARRALAAGVTLESWSVLSLIARLRAAALGFPGLPVRGLSGTSIATDNDVLHRPDGLIEVPALAPDLSFVHAPCADAAGNVLLTPPYGEGLWGAMAAREGVIATVERLVDPEVLRRHAHLPVIPAERVRAVCVVPFGAHPAGLAASGIEGVEPYGDDVAFYAAGRRAGRTEGTWSEWVDRWLAQPADRDAYLARVGAERLLWLQGKARPDSWRPELLSARARLDLAAPATPTEAMVVTAARTLARKTPASGGAILSGLGAGNLAAWLAHGLLSAEGTPVRLVAELGMAGYAPRPCDPFLFNFRNLATCEVRADALTALGLLVGGANADCLGALGAGQVDGRGRFNSTRLADGTLLVGSGGAADVAGTAREVVLTLPAAPGRLVEAVPYVTGIGERVTAVVTDRGVFEKPLGEAPLRLTRLVGAASGDADDPEDRVRDLSARVGFSFAVDPALVTEPPPTAPELERIRLHDPERFFLGPAADA